MLAYLASSRTVEPKGKRTGKVSLSGNSRFCRVCPGRVRETGTRPGQPFRNHVLPAHRGPELSGSRTRTHEVGTVVGFVALKVEVCPGPLG